MNTKNQKYSSEEILSILIEQHRLCAELNLGDPDMEITWHMSILNWRVASDLKKWDGLSEYLNEGWQVEIPKDEWKQVFEPQSEKKLIGLCDLIAKYATKHEFGSKKVMGKECLAAGLFLGIKRGLESRGIDTSNLKPSSEIKHYLTNHISEVIEEVTQTGISVVERIELSKRKKVKTTLIQKLNIFDRYHYDIYFSNINTFRELIEKIINNKKSITMYKNHSHPSG